MKKPKNIGEQFTKAYDGLTPEEMDSVIEALENSAKAKNEGRTPTS